MSNALAIAAVTSALRNLLEAGINDGGVIDFTSVTTQPLDRARGSGDSANQLNLFLYQTGVSAAYRNMDMPRQTRPNEVAQPPLPLNLYYLVTAYGRDNDDLHSHRVLGRAMSVLHDHPLLDPSEVRAALPEADLHSQVERVRITPQPLSLEELTKLWGSFQAQYRISAAYQVALVLIESMRPARMALPVLTQGENDRGPRAAPDMAPPFPLLRAAEPPSGHESALIGETVTLRGANLRCDSATVRLSRLPLASPEAPELREIPLPAQTNPGAMSVAIPDDPAAYAAGVYNVSAVVRVAGEKDRETNSVPLIVAPAITISPTTASPGEVNLTITVRPQVRPDQRATLLFGDRPIAAAARTSPTDILSFRVPDVVAGEYLVRLRVDGVDSRLIDRAARPPAFLASQKVTVA